MPLVQVGEETNSNPVLNGCGRRRSYENDVSPEYAKIIQSENCQQ